ncbi:hypothetical protein N2152v2_000833 [Parachlorella kessleri]
MTAGLYQSPAVTAVAVLALVVGFQVCSTYGVLQKTQARRESGEPGLEKAHRRAGGGQVPQLPVATEGPAAAATRAASSPGPQRRIVLDKTAAAIPTAAARNLSVATAAVGREEAAVPPPRAGITPAPHQDAAALGTPSIVSSGTGSSSGGSGSSASTLSSPSGRGSVSISTTSSSAGYTRDEMYVALCLAVKDFIQAGTVQYIRLDGPLGKAGERQLLAIYHDCLHLFGRQHTWLGFVDADEYVMVMDGSADLPTVLRRYEGYGGLAINWRLFGSSGLLERPTRGVLQSFTACTAPAYPENIHVRSFVRPERVAGVSWNPHAFEYKEGAFAVNTNLTRVDGPWSDPVQSSTLVINHYAVRSRADFEQKLAKGGGMGPEHKKTNDFWERMEKWSLEKCMYAVEAGAKRAGGPSQPAEKRAKREKQSKPGQATNGTTAQETPAAGAATAEEHSGEEGQQAEMQYFLMKVVREAYWDPSQWDPQSKYFDKTSSEEKPKWVMVDCKLVRKLQRPVTLEELKQHKEGALAGMHLFKYGRLSVQAVQPAEWEFVLRLEQSPEGSEEK